MKGSIKFALDGTLSMMFTIWGQFIDHDISLVKTIEEEHMNIPIPWCDEFLDT